MALFTILFILTPCGLARMFTKSSEIDVHSFVHTCVRVYVYLGCEGRGRMRFGTTNAPYFLLSSLLFIIPILLFFFLTPAVS